MSLSLVIGKMKIKTTMGQHFYIPQIAKVFKSNDKRLASRNGDQTTHPTDGSDEVWTEGTAPAVEGTEWRPNAGRNCN